MPVEYIRPNWDDFEDWLDAHYEWEYRNPEGTREIVVALPLPVDNREIRIFTTIDPDGEGRDVGSDAIRTVIWDLNHDVPVGGRERTNRIRTPDDPIRYLRNMHEKVQWLYNNWRAFRHPMDCPECGSVRRLGDGEWGEYLWCTNEDCDHTESLPDASCPECGGGMMLREGQYGEFLACTECDNTEDA